ncbi:MAG: type II secretion system protein [Sedimentisphaerales bacterium]|nr:type II secretion system protein [Sedimentisphaerales bacterium]
MTDRIKQYPANNNMKAADNKGFSLIEALIAVLLVGLAIASLMAANSALTKANAAGTELSTAEFLIEQIRELAALSNYDDLHDFDGAEFAPPINSNGQPLNDFTAFSQQVTVENVSKSDFEQIVADHSSDFVRVTVRVIYSGRQISSTSWLHARY